MQQMAQEAKDAEARTLEARQQASRELMASVVESNAALAAQKHAALEQEGSAQTVAIVTVINEYELVSIGIQRGIIDPELFSRWCRYIRLY